MIRQNRAQEIILIMLEKKNGILVFLRSELVYHYRFVDIY